MTYTIFDVENDTMTQFTALDNGNIEIVNSFLSGSSPLTVEISIDELQKLVTAPLSENMGSFIAMMFFQVFALHRLPAENSEPQVPQG